jgi:hypothetical protein
MKTIYAGSAVLVKAGRFKGYQGRVHEIFGDRAEVRFDGDPKHIHDLPLRILECADTYGGNTELFTALF